MSLAIVVGMLVSLQPPLNAILSRAIGSSMAATVISVSIALLTALALLVLTQRSAVDLRALAKVPVWVYLAGTVGAVFVAAGVVIAPITGAMAFFVCVVAGQLAGSMIADHLGAFGLQVRVISAERLIGFGLVVGGAVMVGRG